MKTFFAIAAFAAFAPLAAAQQLLRSHPADPDIPVPTTKYESAFSRYVSYREQDIAPWRDVNDEVSKIGGHTGIVGGTHGGHAPTKPVAKSPAKSSPPPGNPAPAQK